MAGSRLIFDVGAYKGQKIAGYLRAGAKVVAFEPNPDYTDFLSGRFPGVTVVQKALGPVEGTVKLMICAKVPSVSTCALHWTQGRFQRYRWDRQVEVSQTTLDAAIAEYGRPDFIKIDVEGYEHEVLTGLHIRVPELSFEFANEFQDRLLSCLMRLMILGYENFNFKLGKGRDFAISWGPLEAIPEALKNEPITAWGDVYAR